MKLTFPTEHIRNSSLCGTILTGNWKKDSYTTKAVRKTHMELGRNGREVIGLGPVPLRGNSVEKEDHMGKDPPWGVSCSSRILGTPVLRSKTGKMSLLGWSENCWD